MLAVNVVIFQFDKVLTQHEWSDLHTVMYQDDEMELDDKKILNFERFGMWNAFVYKMKIWRFNLILILNFSTNQDCI